MQNNFNGLSQFQVDLRRLSPETRRMIPILVTPHNVREYTQYPQLKIVASRYFLLDSN